MATNGMESNKGRNETSPKQPGVTMSRSLTKQNRVQESYENRMMKSFGLMNRVDVGIMDGYGIKYTTPTEGFFDCRCKSSCDQDKCGCHRTSNFCDSTEFDAKDEGCKCGVKCGNRYRDFSANVMVMSFQKYNGHGIIATRDIEKEANVCELVGTIKSMVNDGRRIHHGYLLNGLGEFIYQIFVDTKTIIYMDCDRSYPSSEINHSCNPNAKFVERWAHGYKVVMIVALKKIHKGTEVTVSYPQNFGFKEPFLCKCSKGCRRLVGKFGLTKAETKYYSDSEPATEELNPSHLSSRNEDRDSCADVSARKHRKLDHVNPVAISREEEMASLRMRLSDATEKIASVMVERDQLEERNHNLEATVRELREQINRKENMSSSSKDGINELVEELNEFRESEMSLKEQSNFVLSVVMADTLESFDCSICGIKCISKDILMKHVLSRRNHYHAVKSVVKMMPGFRGMLSRTYQNILDSTLKSQGIEMANSRKCFCFCFNPVIDWRLRKLISFFLFTAISIPTFVDTATILTMDNVLAICKLKPWTYFQIISGLGVIGLIVNLVVSACRYNWNAEQVSSWLALKTLEWMFPMAASFAGGALCVTIWKWFEKKKPRTQEVGTQTDDSINDEDDAMELEGSEFFDHN